MPRASAALNAVCWPTRVAAAANSQPGSHDTALGSGTANLSADVTGRPAPLLRVSLTPTGCQTDSQNARRAPFIAPGVLSRTLSPLSRPPPFHWRGLFFTRPCERRLLAPHLRRPALSWEGGCTDASWHRAATWSVGAGRTLFSPVARHKRP